MPEISCQRILSGLNSSKPGPRGGQWGAPLSLQRQCLQCQRLQRSSHLQYINSSTSNLYSQGYINGCICGYCWGCRYINRPSQCNPSWIEQSGMRTTGRARTIISDGSTDSDHHHRPSHNTFLQRWQPTGPMRQQSHHRIDQPTMQWTMLCGLYWSKKS